MTRLAVIGAGLAGLVVARALQRDHDVTGFEKSRGTGGRMATRYEKGYEFDHGAQFFTARTQEFQGYLQPLLERGIVANWRACFAEVNQAGVLNARQWNDHNPHYVGAPRMNAVGKSLGEDLNISLNTTVARLEPCRGGWLLADSNETPLGRFDWVILAMPAAQAAALAPELSALRQHACSVNMRACIAVMLGFEAPLSLPWQAALVQGADISWVSANNSKPGRPDGFTLVVHSTNAYADAHIDDSMDAVSSHLLSEIADMIGVDGECADVCRLHRWRYANVDSQDGEDCFIDSTARLAACGDWFRRGRIESAFLSGFSLARKLSSRLR